MLYGWTGENLSIACEFDSNLEYIPIMGSKQGPLPAENVLSTQPTPRL